MFIKELIDYLKKLFLWTVTNEKGIICSKLSEQIPFIKSYIANDGNLTITIDDKIYEFELTWESREDGFSRLIEIK